MKGSIAGILLSCLFVASCQAFAPVSQTFRTRMATPKGGLATTSPLEQYAPFALQRQRKSKASVQTMGLFGLGAPEIAIILVAAAFLLGPQKLAEFGKDAGKIAGELKEVPKEFQKGMAEGEAEAKLMKEKAATEDKSKEAELEQSKD